MRGTVGEFVGEAVDVLAAAGVSSATVDARRLAVVAGGCDEVALVRHWRDAPPWPGFDRWFASLVARRAERVPLQYLEGVAAFRDFEVAVGPGALIPRPETEVVVEVALEHAPEAGRVLDAGTGTGVIAIAIARARGNAEVHATERSMAALVWAGRNIAALAPQVVLHEQWYLGLPGDFDLIVSNPPYVDAADFAALDPEVRDHEPRVALVPASGDGLSDLALLVREAPARLRPGGTLVCEIGSDQGEAVVDVAVRCWGHVEVRPDLAGRDRVLVCREPLER